MIRFEIFLLPKIKRVQECSRLVKVFKIIEGNIKNTFSNVVMSTKHVNTTGKVHPEVICQMSRLNLQYEISNITI